MEISTIRLHRGHDSRPGRRYPQEFRGHARSGQGLAHVSPL